MKQSIISKKSFLFAVESVKLHQTMKEKGIAVIANQFLRSSTSVGANVAEAYGSQSERDFYSKLSIARKEARESFYWLRLVKETSDMEVDALLFLADEMVRLLTSTTKTLEKKLGL